MPKILYSSNRQLRNYHRCLSNSLLYHRTLKVPIIISTQLVYYTCFSHQLQAKFSSNLKLYSNL